MPSSSTVKYEIRDRVAWVTLNRPEAMNALNTEIRQALGETMIELSNNDDVLVVIITGEGGRAFCAGNDLKEAARADSGGERVARGYSGGQQVWECPKPVIAAIDGYALAGGMQLSARCDIRIATEKSRFGQPEPRWSLVAAGALDTPERFMPIGEAMWILLTGSQMTAQRAYDVGFIQALVPNRDALFAEAKRVADDIKLCAPLALRAIKQSARAGQNLPIEWSQRLREALSEKVNSSEDRPEGPKAFAEKRIPAWKGR